MCDKKHANKHQVKEDQTHMPLPPEGTSHAILLVDIPSGKEQCLCIYIHVEKLEFLFKTAQRAVNNIILL